MNDDAARALARSLARIEAELAAQRQMLEQIERALNPAFSIYADLEHAIRTYFGTKAMFTASGVCMAADQDSDLFDAVHVHVDLDAPNPAIHMGRTLAKCPNVERVADKRGSGLFRLRR